MINDAIYSRQKGVPDLVDSFGSGMSIGRMIKKNRLENKKLKEGEKIKGIFQKNTSQGEDGNIKLNRKATLLEMMGTDPLKALQYKAQWDQEDVLKQDRANKEIDRKHSRKMKEKELGIKERTAISKGSVSEAKKAFDREAGKELAKFTTGGGKATIDKNLSRLSGAIERLGQSDDLTGGLSTKIPYFKDDDTQDWLNPKMATVRDDIRSAIQGSLKATLGAQFTEKEAEQMFSRAFNPRLSDQENMRRAQVELDALSQMASNKQQASKYFQENGSLVGFSPEESRQQSRNIAKSPQGASGGWNPIQNAHAANPLDHPEKNNALDWAKKNPNDPRAVRILQMFGAN